MIGLYAAEERNVEVVEAARDWAAAGLVTKDQLGAIEAAFRPGLARVNLFFRILLAASALTATVSAVALVEATLELRDLGGGLLALAAAAGSALLADRWLIGGKRLYRCGAEEALLSAAIGFVALGLCLLAETFGASWKILDPLGRFVVVLGASAAAVRYGNPLFALAATLSLASLPAAFEIFDPLAVRILSAIFMAVPAALSYRLLARDRQGDTTLLPGDRRCLETVRWVCLAILYADLNSYVDSVSTHWPFPPAGPAVSVPLWRTWLCAAATAGLPVAGLALGIRRRDRALLWFGGLSAVASLLTLKYFFHLGYLAQELTAAGALLAATAWLLLRWLRSGPSRERGGFTAERLLDPRLYGLDLEALAAVQPLAPGAAGDQGHGFRPGGGGFGGGGASGGTS